MLQFIQLPVRRIGLRIRMKKWFALFIAIALLSVSFCAAADGVTLKTVSSFAGTDAAAGAYVDILKAYIRKGIIRLPARRTA